MFNIWKSISILPLHIPFLFFLENNNRRKFCRTRIGLAREENGGDGWKGRGEHFGFICIFYILSWGFFLLLRYDI